MVMSGSGTLSTQPLPKLMFSSDWPHHEGSHDPIGNFEKELEFISDRHDFKEIRRRFYYDNLAELLGS